MSPRGPAGREAVWGLSRSPTRTAARAAWHQTRVSRVRGSGLRLWPSGRSSFLRVMLLALLGRGRALLDARLCGDFRGAVRGPSEAPLPPASLGPARRQGCPLQGKPGPRGRRAQEAGSQSSSRSWSRSSSRGRQRLPGKAALSSRSWENAGSGHRAHSCVSPPSALRSFRISCPGAPWRAGAAVQLRSGRRLLVCPRFAPSDLVLARRGE